MKVDILKIGSPALDMMCSAVVVGSDVRDTIDLMREALNQNPGVGLAANQIGIPSRIILINHFLFVGVIINPTISWHCGKDRNSREGCLSIPNKTYVVRRKNQVVVEGFDENWKPFKKKFRWPLSAIVQHEIDHLNGYTLEDK